MTSDAIKEIIFENATGNVLDRAYKSMKNAIKFGERFEKTKYEDVSGMFWNWSYDCTESQVIEFARGL